MQGTIRCCVIAGLLLGCHTDDTDPPRNDASGGPTGLIVTWSSQPASLPSDLGDAVILERARFQVDSLRVIGDAGPGDPRTTARALEVRWDDSVHPVDQVFDQAPPGLYSQVSVQLDGGVNDNSFELSGHAFVNGDTWEYRIEDANPLAFTIPIDKPLGPGETVIVGLRVNFVHALDAVELALLPVDDGHLQLDETGSMMPVFRQKLVESFEIVNVAQGTR